jgi:hypothetical protein
VFPPGKVNRVGLLFPHYLSMLIPTLPREATLQSWAIKYVGNASVSLYEHLASHPKDEDNYARYTSIVQSSGMGKSRAVDELSKIHLVVPLTLRQESKGKYLRITIGPSSHLKTRVSGRG